MTRVKLRVFAYKEITEQQADSPFLPTLGAPPPTRHLYIIPLGNKRRLAWVCGFGSSSVALDLQRVYGKNLCRKKGEEA